MKVDVVYKKARDYFHTSASQMAYDLAEKVEWLRRVEISKTKFMEVVMIYLMKAKMEGRELKNDRK